MSRLAVVSSAHARGHANLVCCDRTDPPHSNALPTTASSLDFGPAKPALRDRGSSRRESRRTRRRCVAHQLPATLQEGVVVFEARCPLRSPTCLAVQEPLQCRARVGVSGRALWGILLRVGVTQLSLSTPGKPEAIKLISTGDPSPNRKIS